MDLSMDLSDGEVGSRNILPAASTYVLPLLAILAALDPDGSIPGSPGQRIR
jgi:hypothetical protein